LWESQIVPDFVIEKVGEKGGWAAKGRLHCLHARKASYLISELTLGFVNWIRLKQN